MHWRHLNGLEKSLETFPDSSSTRRGFVEFDRRYCNFKLP